MSELFSAFGIEWKLLLAQAVNFGIVFVALTYFLYKPVLKLLSEREEKIKKGVEDAEAAAQAVQGMESERSKVMADANKEADAVVTRASQAGKDERAAIVKNAQTQAESTLRDAEAQAAEMKREALAKSEKEIVAAAVLMTEKMIREKIS